MSNAAEKNRQAIAAHFGNDALAGKFMATRLAVVLPSSSTPASGQLLAEFLADTLGRLWLNIDFHGELAGIALEACQQAARSGGSPADGLRTGWAPPYDLVINVGGPAPDHSSPELRVGGNGWMASLGGEAACGSSLNPVGPAFAAANASAQAFAILFCTELGNDDVSPSANWTADVRELLGAPGLELCDIDLEETHVFGVGAVSHGMVQLLERWPMAVRGVLNLVDGDRYGLSNGQRYASMPDGVVGLFKVEVVAARLRKHVGLQVFPHPQDLNAYCADRGYEVPLRRAVCGLDSAEGRRQVALKLPERTINMWTHRDHAGAGLYVPGQGRGCLCCAYPEPSSTLDEVASFAGQTGLHPDEVRSLLDSARGLNAEEAHKVSAQRGVPAEKLEGEPLRSVLPVLCATGQVMPPNAADAVDVPFAFSSLLAGITGFVMLLRELQFGHAASSEWKHRVFKRPTSLMLSDFHRKASCVLCTELQAAGDF